MTQQLVLDPLGLVTQPNKLGQVPAGALTACNQVVLRSPGTLENLPGWTQRGSAIGSTQVPFHICMPNKWILVIRHSGIAWGYTWYDADTNTFTYTGDLAWEDGNAAVRTTEQPRFSHVTVGDQLFVQFRSQLLVWDTINPTSLATSKPRHAGLLGPKIALPTNAYFGGTAIQGGKYATYTAIFKRSLPNNDRIIVSAPCAAVSHSNLFTQPVDVTLYVSLGTTLPQARAGDVLEIYRTKSKPHNLTNVFTTVQPGEEAGSEYLRCGSITLTAAHISAGFFYYTDACPDTALGEALYTNQSVGSFADEADMPPAHDFITAYKGYLFGLGPTYTPRLKLRPIGLWGAVDAALNTVKASSVLGRISIAGTTWTTGSSTVTVATGTEAAKVFKAQYFYPGGSGSGFPVTNVAGTTITVSGALPTGQSNVTSFVIDTLSVQYGIAENVSNTENWYNYQYSQNLQTRFAVHALALKLPSMGQEFLSTNVNTQPTDVFEIRAQYLYDARDPLLVRGSKPLAWDPQIDPTNQISVPAEYKPHAVTWSNLSEPEAWPILNQDFFSRGLPHCVATTADAVIAAYSDGIWRISGTGGSTNEGFDWRYDQIATGITVRGSQCMCVLLDRVYALTSEGLVVIDGDRVQRISEGRIHDQLDVPGFRDVPHTTGTAVWICADEENNEIVFRTPETGSAIWVYNTNTDRFTKIGSHDFPVFAQYSPYLRSVVYLGQTSGTWSLLTPSNGNAYNDMSMTFARVYADNPFAQRHWQTLSVSAEVTGGPVTLTPSFNGLAGTPRTLDASGRASFEVPRNAPAIGNTMTIGLTVAANGGRVKLHGFALDYRDQTERRRNR